jgi:branched-chain amino acid transport system substrate-binding protein
VRKLRAAGVARVLAGAAAVAGTLSLAMAGCGSSARWGDLVSGKTLTIYSSLPLHGDASANARSVLAGETLALSQLSGRVGRFRIVLRSLDDSSQARGGWDPGQTGINARLAIADRSTIGYLGDFNSGASAISIPLLNRGYIPQLSSASAAVGLTSGAVGASPGEPEKYYPTDVRTFARVPPSDAVQAAVLVRLQQQRRCKRGYVLHDGSVDGQNVGESYALTAQTSGLQVLAVTRFDPRAADFTALAGGVASSGADCLLVAGIGGPGSTLLIRQLAAALPRASLFASAGLADSAFSDPGTGAIPSSLDRRLVVTAPGLARADYPQAGRAFFAAYAARYGTPRPYAIYGYEAMSLMLSAISRATGGGTQSARRSKVLAAIFDTRNRQSVLGTYSLDRDGDTTLRHYGAYRAVGGKLQFWKTVEA